MARRIVSLDIFRAMLIGYVIFLHPLLQRVFNQESSAFGDIVAELNPIFIIFLAPLAIFALWGTAFMLISGAATSYQVLRKLNLPNKEYSKITRQKLVNALLIYAFHFMFVGIFSNFTSNEHPITTYSLITGSLELGYFTPFNGMMLLTSSVLEAIALSNILITAIFHLINKKKITDSKKIIKIFIIATIILFLIPFIVSKLTASPYDIPYQMFSDGNYVGYYIYMHLFSTRFAFFPVAAFATIGVIFGIYLSEGKSPKEFFKLGIIIFIISILYFLLEILLKFDLIAAFALDYVALPIHALNLGLQVMFLNLLWAIFDHKEKKLPDFLQGTVNRYSNTSLTIFVFEPFISINMRNIFVYFLGVERFQENALAIFFFEVIIILIWFTLLYVWDKKLKLKGSLEWIIGKVKTR